MALNLSAFTVIWILTALVATVYMVRNLRRAQATVTRVMANQNQPIQQFFAVRRMERQVTVLAVEFLLAMAGVLSLFTPRPVVPEVFTYTQIAIPTILIVAHIGLAFFSWQEHVHYHRGINLLMGPDLRNEWEEYKARRDKENRR